MKDKLAILGGAKVRKEPFRFLPEIGAEEKTLVREVLENGMLSGFVAQPGDTFLGGQKVRELEQLCVQYFGVPHAVAMNSATAALHAALAAAGIGAADEVIVTPYTMSATATAILMQNAVPIFADIDPVHFCIDPAQVRKKITPRTKAIMVVHLFGHPADMDPIMAIAREKKLVVIEDCAQAPGAEYKGKRVGTIGDAGIFSLNQHKIITTGEGGIAVTRDADFAFRMQLVRNHGEVVLAEMKLPSLDQAPDLLGWNYRITELEAAVGIGQFKRLDGLTDQRRTLANYLTERLKKFPGLTPPAPAKDVRHVYFTYPIVYDRTRIQDIGRDTFIKALRAEGIPCGGGYVKPIYHQPVYQKKTVYGKQGCPFRCPLYKNEIQYRQGDCPVTESMYAEKLLLLPVCREPHTEWDMDDVLRAFAKIFDSLDDLKSYKEEKVARS